MDENSREDMMGYPLRFIRDYGDIRRGSILYISTVDAIRIVTQGYAVFCFE